MGLFTKDIKTLEDLFSHGLKDIYYAENQILKALPKLIESATNPQLKKGLKDHLEETEGQVSRLEQIFEMREEKPKGTKCPGINGLIKEGDELTGNIADKKVLDAAIISSAQAVEHYEMTRYGALIAWARELGRNDFADILTANLEEEKAADAKLNALAERRVNRWRRDGGTGEEAMSRRRTSASQGSLRGGQWHASKTLLATNQRRSADWSSLVAAGLAGAAWIANRQAREAERRHPPLGTLRYRQGVRLHYIERGSGPAVVFLHGNGAMVDDIIISGVFGLAAQNHRAIIFDRPGFGHSERPSGRRWTASAQAALLPEMFKLLGIDRAIVVGHSLGTLVALAFALDHPRLVSGLVLASGYYFPTPRPMSPWSRRPPFRW